MKKILISSLVALILTFNTLASYQKASANSWVNVPGYADEAFKALMQGVMVVTGGAAHAGNFVEENLKAIVDGAGLTYDQLAPHAKEAFNASLSATADGVVIAGDWIDAFLSTADLPSGAPPVFGQNVSIASDGTFVAYFSPTVNFARTNGSSAELTNWLIKLKDYGAPYGVQVQIWSDSYTQWQSYFCNTGCVVPAIPEMTLSQALGLATSAGFSATVVGADLPTGQLDNIRDHLDRLRQSDGSVRLGVPAGTLVEPWAQTPTGNQRVYWDNTLGEWTLPDGVPIPADQVLSRPRAQGMYGDIPVVVGADGTLIDLLTGQKVATRDQAQTSGIAIPGAIAREWEFQDTLTKNPAKDKELDKPISIPGAFAGPTKPVAWDALKMNAKALTEKFPFSIPWDLMRQLKVFDVGPQTPVFEVNIGDYLKIGGHTIPLNFEIDLSIFDKVAAFIRWFNLILWDIGLVLLIRKLLPE